MLASDDQRKDRRHGCPGKTRPRLRPVGDEDALKDVLGADGLLRRLGDDRLIGFAVNHNLPLALADVADEVLGHILARSHAHNR